MKRLIAGLWLGSAFFLMLAASAAFRSAGNPTTAANVVGAMLSRWHYIALAAPVILFAFELRAVRRAVLIVLFAAIALAASQIFVDMKIRAIRETSIVPVSQLPRTDPARRRFGALHGASMGLLALQALSAAAVACYSDRPRSE